MTHCIQLADKKTDMSVEYAKLVLINEPLYFLQSLYSMHKL